MGLAFLRSGSEQLSAQPREQAQSREVKRHLKYRLALKKNTETTPP